MRRWFALVCCLFLVSTLHIRAQSPQGKAPAASQDGIPAQLPQPERFDPSLIDRSKDPCSDFYEYACSKWIAAHPIPSDMPKVGTGLPLFLYNETVLAQTMEKAAADPHATGSERQIGNYWRSCMDEASRNANEKKWLQPAWREIASLKSKKDLARVLAYLHLNFPAMWEADDNSTKTPFFGFGPAQDLADATKMVAEIDQGGMALPSLDYYLGTTEHFQQLRRQYVAHVQTMFELLGDPAPKATAQAKTVMEMETAFAKASMDNVTRRDPLKIYNKRTLGQVKAAVPVFNWDEYFKDVAAPTVPYYIVTSPGFLTALQQAINSRPVADLQTYLRWWAIHRAAPYLGHDFEQANFDYFGTALSGTPQMLPRWRRCVSSADRYLGYGLLGEEYVKVAFRGDSKQRASELVGRIRQALKDEIEHLDWMDANTKKQALVKEDATLQKIGYPDKWRDYSSVIFVPNNYVANMNAANAFEAHRQLNRIGKPVDRTEWGMTPPTINAYEDPQMNTINFPAGFMQLPFFNVQQDDASNYGGIGMVIGHEIIHGFDDQGRKFDANGNLRDWWTEQDAKRYEQRDKCIVDQYSQEIPEYGVKQNGNLTAGEDTADNGGIHLAMMALEALYQANGKSLDTPDSDGITPRQRFFLNFAFGWCRGIRPEAARQQVITNPHSLEKFRVDRPLSNLPEFQKAYGCKAGQAMVSEPQCRVW
jgi:putative endopeptidase